MRRVQSGVKPAPAPHTGAVNRMLKRKLSMAFEKWQFEAAEMARSKFLLSGALKRLQMRKVAMETFTETLL